MIWLSTGWKDYRLLDCGGGQRYEYWGGHYLVRPDPQAIWQPDGKWDRWGRYIPPQQNGRRLVAGFFTARGLENKIPLPHLQHKNP